MNVEEISWVVERTRVVGGQLRFEACNFYFHLNSAKSMSLCRVVRLKRVDICQMAEGVVRFNVYSWVSRECRKAASASAEEHSGGAARDHVMGSPHQSIAWAHKSLHFTLSLPHARTPCEYTKAM